QAISGGGATPLTAVRPDVDPTLTGVVDRAMALRPEDRFATVADMRTALGDDVTIVADVPTAIAAATAPLAPTAMVESTVAMPAELLESGVRLGGRQRRFVAGLVVGLFVVLLMVALLLGLTASGGSGRNIGPESTTTAT